MGYDVTRWCSLAGALEAFGRNRQGRSMVREDISEGCRGRVVRKKQKLGERIMCACVCVCMCVNLWVCVCVRGKVQTRSKVFSPGLHQEPGDVQVVETVC